MQLDCKKEGVFDDMSNEDYHAHSALGSTGGKIILNTHPEIFRHQLENKVFKRTKCMDFGIAAHVFILENDKFNDQYVVAPENIPMDKRKTAWKDFVKANPNKEVIAFSDHQILLDMRQRFLSSKLAKNILHNSAVEQSHFIVDKDYNVNIKARPDMLHVVGNTIIDLKTTAINLDFDTIQRHIYSMGHYIQAAFHKRVIEQSLGIEIEDIVYIIVSVEPPNLMRIYGFEQDMIEAGDREVDIILSKYNNMVNHNDYESYDVETITRVGLPEYAKKQIRIE